MARREKENETQRGSDGRETASSALSESMLKPRFVHSNPTVDGVIQLE
jgi:hypothetical protein